MDEKIQPMISPRTVVKFNELPISVRKNCLKFRTLEEISKILEDPKKRVLYVISNDTTMGYHPIRAIDNSRKSNKLRRRGPYLTLVVCLK